MIGLRVDATTIAPNPSAPGDLGQLANPFPNVYGANGYFSQFTGPATNQITQAAMAAAAAATNTISGAAIVGTVTASINSSGNVRLQGIMTALGGASVYGITNLNGSGGMDPSGNFFGSTFVAATYAATNTAATNNFAGNVNVGGNLSAANVVPLQNGYVPYTNLNPVIFASWLQFTNAIAGNTNAVAPANSTTIRAWVNFTNISGGVFKMPLYQ